MSNMQSIYKKRVSLLLDNEVVVALDKKAEDDNTSRNDVANYLLGHELQRIIKNFSPADKAKIAEFERKNLEARNAK